MKTFLVCAVLFGLLGAAAVVAYLGWTQLKDVDMGVHGVIALVLGVAATIGLGAGLMALLFYSARKGYDDIDRNGRE